MLERLEHVWRLCATAFSFFLFGAAGIILWGILFPPLAVFLGQGPLRKRRARRLMHELFRCYVFILRALGLLTYEVHDGDRLNRPGRLVVANHPSLIDVVFLISLIRNAGCIIKPALVKNPFMRAPIRATQYLYATEPEALLDRCVDELREGSSLIVFPEGTRTRPNQPRPYQRGVANIALTSGAAILPVYIRCFPVTLTKDSHWYQIPPSRVRYSFHVGEEIDPSPYAEEHNRPMASRRLTEYLRRYFTEQERIHGAA